MSQGQSFGSDFLNIPLLRIKSIRNDYLLKKALQKQSKYSKLLFLQFCKHICRLTQSSCQKKLSIGQITHQLHGMRLWITWTHISETWEADILKKLSRIQAPNKLSDVPEWSRTLKKNKLAFESISSEILVRDPFKELIEPMDISRNL